MTSFDKVTTALHALPVAPMADEVVKSVLSGKVTVLAAPTGSGKSMLVPAMLADALNPNEEEPVNQVVVLVPRRFLATDAAMNVADIAKKTLGNEVGYAIGEMGGETSKKSENTKLLFVTYGYAISSGLINTAQNIVLDEVHEASEDISLARAILYQRKQSKKLRDKDLRILEMSATVNADKQAGYWKNVATTQTFSTDESQLNCEERHTIPTQGAHSLIQTTLDLLKKQEPARKGIAIFRAGVKEVEQTVEDLKKAIASDTTLRDVEVVHIHGGTPPDERKKARAMPKEGTRKIIVGTNVIESGVNLRWVDAGISDGFGKIPYDRFDTGAYALVQENLAEWRIIQQRGRINRSPLTTGFPSGIFILHAKDGMDKRTQPQKPELARRSVRNVAFRAACLGYLPDDLKFDTPITPERWQEAKEELMRLGLICDDWTLTKDGEYVKGLPVSPETGAVLCEARRIDEAAARTGNRHHPKLLGEAIIMAALMEQGGIREEPDLGHKLDGRSDVHGGSDILDGLKAYRHLAKNPNAAIVAHAALQTDELTQAQQAPIDAAREALKQACVAAKLNVSYTSFCNAMLLVNEIRSRHEKPATIALNDREADTAHYNGLKRCVLNGNANRLFQMEVAGGHSYRDLLRDYDKRRNDAGVPFNGYLINPDSVECRTPKADNPDHPQRIKVRGQEPLLVGRLREKPSKGGGDGVAFIDQVTSIPAQVFLDWATTRDQDAAESQKLLQNAERDKSTLSGCYAGKASFDIPLTMQKANAR